MTEQAENNVVSINGTDHDAADFNDEQKYVVAQLRDLQTKSDNLRFQADQIAAAQKVFTDTLIASVEAKDDPSAEASAAS